MHTHGYGLLEYVLGLTLLVIAVSVMIDVYTAPVINVARRAKKQHFSNTHKHRRGH